MKLNPSEIKTRSKQIMVESKPKETGVAALFVIVSLVFSYLLFNLSGYNSNEVYERLMTYYSGGYFDEAMEYLMSIQPTPFQSFASMLLFLTFIIINTGLTIFIMNTVRGKEPCYGNLLDGFSSAFRILILSLVRVVLISVGSLLFLIPGIILFYSYRMSVYLLIDRHDLSPFECLRESRRIMKGHKLELFRLDMSFILWFLIASLPYIGPVSEILSTPYRYNSYILFYDSIRGVEEITEN